MKSEKEIFNRLQQHTAPAPNWARMEARLEGRKPAAWYVWRAAATLVVLVGLAGVYFTAFRGGFTSGNQGQPKGGQLASQPAPHTAPTAQPTQTEGLAQSQGQGTAPLATNAATPLAGNGRPASSAAIASAATAGTAINNGQATPSATKTGAKSKQHLPANSYYQTGQNEEANTPALLARQNSIKSEAGQIPSSAESGPSLAQAQMASAPAEEEFNPNYLVMELHPEKPKTFAGLASADILSIELRPSAGQDAQGMQAVEKDVQRLVNTVKTLPDQKLIADARATVRSFLSNPVAALQGRPSKEDN